MPAPGPARRTLDCVRRVLAPRFWGVHLLAALLVAVAAWLGLWQFHAWEARRAAEARDLTTVEPIPLADAMGPDDPFPGDLVGQPVVLDGTWVPESTLFVSGRQYDGRDGYWVVTPLEVDPDAAALLVVRGWTPSPESAPPPPEGTAELLGWLQPPEGTGEVDQDPTDDVLPQLRIADAVQHVDQDLYGAYAVVADRTGPGPWPVGDRATNPGTAGLEQASLDEVPKPGQLNAIRNLFYALQWWLFGGFAVFVWWRHLTDTVALERAAEAAQDPADQEAASAAPGGQ
jgi:surfeit locus 1 family protein